MPVSDPVVRSSRRALEQLMYFKSVLVRDLKKV